MKVKELIELLKTCNYDETVILCVNSNKASIVDEFSRDIYRPDSTSNGFIVQYENDRQKGDIDVVTLWPEDYTSKQRAN